MVHGAHLAPALHPVPCPSGPSGATDETLQLGFDQAWPCRHAPLRTPLAWMRHPEGGEAFAAHTCPATSPYTHSATQAHMHTCTHTYAPHMHTCTHAHMHTCTHAHKKISAAQQPHGVYASHNHWDLTTTGTILHNRGTITNRQPSMRLCLGLLLDGEACAWHHRVPGYQGTSASVVPLTRKEHHSWRGQ
jgi:hypothetical protein